MRSAITRRVLAPAIAITLGLASVARADPYRLRVDSVGYTQSPQSPVGLLVLQGEDRANRWVDAEALAWAGTANGKYDVLTALVRLHDPKNFAELRLGRQLLTVGALRPVHVDGADVRLRAPSGTSMEAFGGVPVEPQFAYRAYDWLVGGRVAQRAGQTTSLGLSYLEQREDGRLAYEEAGIDFASAPARWFDLAAHGAYDLIDPGLAEAGASLAGRFGDFRPEIYATHRSPSRLIPATSLFSALGDTPSDVVGASLKWRMFPRLDVLPLVGVRSVGGEAGVDGTLRVTLRLDDRGAGTISAEGRRQGAGSDKWTGLRLTSRVPLSARVRCSTELELVAPDDPRGRGALWPWGLVAVTWAPAAGWELAGAVEAASTPTAVREVNGLARVSWAWEKR
jgi:hypothetical protein